MIWAITQPTDLSLNWSYLPFFFFCFRIVIDVRNWKPSDWEKAVVSICWTVSVLTDTAVLECKLHALVFGGNTAHDECANMRLVLWKNNKDHTDVKHDGISRNKMWFLSSPQFRVLCSHHSLGRHPTKQLASMGIPAVLSNKSLPPFFFFLLLSVLGRDEAKFIFFTVVPLRWWRGPCHAAADVLGEGPRRDTSGTLLLQQHSILLLLFEETRQCLFLRRWGNKCIKSESKSLLNKKSYQWQIRL